MESLIGEGFAELFDSTHESMLRIALGETRDRQLALDACQNAYLKLLRARRDGTAIAEPQAWLARVVRNEVRALGWARQTPVGPLISLDAAPPSCVESQTDLGHERAETARAALAGLPAGLREASRLRFDEGLTFRQMGEALGCSESAAHRRLGAALDRLRRSLLHGPGRPES